MLSSKNASFENRVEFYCTRNSDEAKKQTNSYKSRQEY